MAQRRQDVEVDGRRLSLSNLDKVLYPAAGTTKADIVRYYAEVAPVLLPHLVGRPLTLKRYPDGVDGPSFFEKRCPGHRPRWVPTVTLGREGRDKVVDHCDVRETAALVWLANLAALELHTSLATAPDTTRPRAVVFDLDPGAPADQRTCAQVALWLKDLCDRLDLEVLPKTSGGKGLQLYVPINRDDVTYEDTRGFAKAVAELLERVHGDVVVSTQDKQQRVGKVLIDWLQNHLTKSTVCVYSLRARQRPTVSTPITWDEVAAAVDGDVPTPLAFEPGDVLARVAADGDRFAPVLDVRQELPPLR